VWDIITDDSATLTLHVGYKDSWCLGTTLQFVISQNAVSDI